ncbi:MAG: response regulator [Acidobacteria bacterium]|nr:response regulator [Acidobacteriota bacterium]
MRMGPEGLRHPSGWPAQAPVPVLLVDDDQTYARFLRGAFAHAEGARLDLRHVNRLREVLPALEAQPATVLLLDINLPDGNGLEWLRVNRQRVDAAVIVLTSMAGYAAGPDVVEGAQDFLVKSEVDPDQLARVVQYAADRERARQELVRSREYFQSLIEQARDLITVVDERGIILYQSPGTRRLLDLSSEAFVGRSIFTLVEGEQAARGRELLEAVLGGVDVPSGQVTVRHADGSLRYIDVVASRIAPENGVRRVVLNTRDVTERQRAEEALRARDEMLLRAQKMEAVGRLAGGIAHDFSNVLTVVTSACERLQDTLPTESSSGREIEMILRNCERAASLIRQLLAFSRQQTLAPRPIDLGRLARAAGDLLTQFIGEHIQLTIDVASDLHAVEADPGQIEQVLMNLAINARDAMPEGGRLAVRLQNVTLDEEFAQNHAPQPPGEYVLLQVSDTGHGMSAETREHDFEPFFTTKDAAHGSGLGLSTVYGIVKQSGGYIWIDSEPGQGTVISVYLPPTSAVPVEPETPTPHAPESVQARTVLLTEDEDDVRLLVRDILAAHGYHVLAARDPADAMARAAAYGGTIELLLTDVVMPGGNGRDLARRMSAVRPGLKVLYMSGYPEHGAAPGSVLESGAPFLAKPFTRDALLQKIRELLG